MILVSFEIGRGVKLTVGSNPTLSTLSALSALWLLGFRRFPNGREPNEYSGGLRFFRRIGKRRMGPPINDGGPSVLRSFPNTTVPLVLHACHAPVCV